MQIFSSPFTIKLGILVKTLVSFDEPISWVKLFVISFNVLFIVNAHYVNFLLMYIQQFVTNLFTFNGYLERLL